MQQLHGFLPGWFPSRGRLVAARLVNRELAPIPTESARATCDAAIPAKAKIDRADFGRRTMGSCLRRDHDFARSNVRLGAGAAGDEAVMLGAAVLFEIEHGAA